MKVAIPVIEYCGLESLINGHFGSAPAFALVDSETLDVEPLINQNSDHVHGMCSPMRALAGAKPDAVIVGGIGAGALMGLRSAGIKVYRSVEGTVVQAVKQLKSGKLIEMAEDAVCSGHANGHTCH